MSTQWLDLLHRFESRLEAVEKNETPRSEAWRLICLERALELLEEDPDAASRHLDDFDRPSPTSEVADMFAKSGEQATIEDIRSRFKNLGAGIV